MRKGQIYTEFTALCVFNTQAGGGAALFDCPMSVVDSSLSNNRASQGGGVYFSVGPSILSFRGDCNVSRNAARLAGGFGYVASSGKGVEITGVSSPPGLNSSDIGGIVVDYSSSDDDGGGIFIAANTVHISGLTSPTCRSQRTSSKSPF